MAYLGISMEYVGKSMEYVGLSMGYASLKGTRSPGLQQPRLKATFTQQACWTADAIIWAQTFDEPSPNWDLGGAAQVGFFEVGS